jgi:hypothetical protein
MGRCGQTLPTTRAEAKVFTDLSSAGVAGLHSTCPTEAMGRHPLPDKN